MAEFNLEQALAGAPVRLRNGFKAFVLAELKNPLSKLDQLLGYVEFGSGEHRQDPISWSIEGKYSFVQEKSASDIVGMWQEPENQEEKQNARI